jgi:predicted PurR-regulated permease PerM
MRYIKPTSYFLVAFSILFLFYFHLIGGLIGGLTVFLIVNQLHSWLGTKVHSKWAHKATMLAVTVLTVLILSLIGLGIYSGLSGGQSHFANLSNDVLNVIQQLRTYLPESLLHYIPDDVMELKTQVSEVVKKHLPNLLSFTTSSAHALFIVIIGMLIGAVIAFSFLKDDEPEALGPFSAELVERIRLFATVFQKVVFAQVKISAINTTLTGIYLLLILPFAGVHVSYAKTLVLLTFVFGLLPVIGNLISNTLIVVLSLMVSFNVAIASLTFLVVVHKLEYYVNAKIIGNKLKVSIWEMLIAIIVFETVFGVLGAVLSPVIYGYIKEELKKHNLI